MLAITLDETSSGVLKRPPLLEVTRLHVHEHPGEPFRDDVLPAQRLTTLAAEDAGTGVHASSSPDRGPGALAPFLAFDFGGPGSGNTPYESIEVRLTLCGEGCIGEAHDSTSGPCGGVLRSGGDPSTRWVCGDLRRKHAGHRHHRERRHPHSTRDAPSEDPHLRKLARTRSSRRGAELAGR